MVCELEGFGEFSVGGMVCIFSGVLLGRYIVVVGIMFCWMFGNLGLEVSLVYIGVVCSFYRERGFIVLFID